MERIDISKHQHLPYSPRDRDIETALVWNAVKKTLEEHGRSDLFGYIKSIKITEKQVRIMTGKPIVNTELHLYRETLLKNITRTLQVVSKPLERKLMFF